MAHHKEHEGHEKKEHMGHKGAKGVMKKESGFGAKLGKSRGKSGLEGPGEKMKK